MTDHPDAPALAATEDTLADLRAQLAEARAAWDELAPHIWAGDTEGETEYERALIRMKKAIDAARASVSPGRTDTNRENDHA